MSLQFRFQITIGIFVIFFLFTSLQRFKRFFFICIACDCCSCHFALNTYFTDVSLFALIVVVCIYAFLMAIIFILSNYTNMTKIKTKQKLYFAFLLNFKKKNDRRPWIESMLIWIFTANCIFVAFIFVPHRI